jgi:hypothetical protein
MATRWSFSRRLALVALLAALPACVTTTTVGYVPEPDVERLSLVQGQALLQQFVGVECGRLVQEQKAEAVTRVDVDLDARGEVTEARLQRTVGDERVDGMIGAVAAKLRLDPPTNARRSPEHGELRAGYKCQPQETVVVLQRL